MTSPATGEGPAPESDLRGSPAEHRATTREEPVLPEQTRDDTDRGWGAERGNDEHDVEGHDDERFLRERPPHWQ